MNSGFTSVQSARLNWNRRCGEAYNNVNKRFLRPRRGSGVKDSCRVNCRGIRRLRRGNGVAGLALRMWE